MTPENLLGLIYDRGLRPEIDSDSGRLVVHDPNPRSGTLAGLSHNLQKTIEFHREGLTRLVAVGWVPPLKGGRRVAEATHAPQVVAGQPAFDHEAEKAVRDLYGIGYGVRWRDTPEGGSPVIWPAKPTPTLRAVWNRIRPLWGRVRDHVAPKAGLVEYRSVRDSDPDERARHVARGWREYADADGTTHTAFGRLVRLPDQELGHLFHSVPPPGFDHWRYLGETHWRALWGRWECEGRWTFYPFGSSPVEDGPVAYEHP